MPVQAGEGGGAAAAGAGVEQVEKALKAATMEDREDEAVAQAGAEGGVEEEGSDRRASGDENWRVLEFRGGEATRGAVRRLQRWWRAHRRAAQAAAAMAAQGEKLKGAAAVLASRSSDGFEDVLQRIQSKELIASVAGLLAAVNGPGVLPPMSPRLRRSPRAIDMAYQQQARKFLTSLMIKHHPDEVITDDEGAASLETLEARLLRVSAELALVSAVALIRAVDDVQAGKPGALATFRLRLNTFAFARDFLHEALQVLQAIRTSGVAASFLASYGEAYRYLKDAERSHQETLIVAARQSLDKVKMGIAKVLGKEKTEKHCLRVEQALDSHEPFVVLSPGDIKVPLPPMGSPPRRPAPENTNTSGSGGGGGSSSSSDNDDGAATAGSAAGPAAASEPGYPSEAGPLEGEGEGERLPVPVPPNLTVLLRNEHLAHEIILNPDFKLEDGRASQPEGLLAVHMKQVREAMEKVFWDRLTLALTPAEQENDADFVPGARVQLRFGGPQGSFYAATVDAVHAEDGTLSVTYLTDGMRERRPLGDFRRRSDPLDFEPLLALLEDVRAKLVELTPKRKDLAAELEAKLDVALLRQMGQRGLLDAATVRGLLAFVVARLMALQAPQRAAETAAWFGSMEAEVQAAVEASGSGAMGPAFVRLLPTVFQTVFERIDETRRDAANAHVAMLRPFLQQHGVAYERQKFQERLKAGEVKLAHTQAWLRDVVHSPERRPTLGALARGDEGAHRRLLAEALSHLLRQPVRLDNPSTARLPETLFYDGRRLAALRDELDRLTLVAVYSTLLRQFLANQGRLNLRVARSAGEALAALETRLYTILRDDHEVKLPHLVDEVVQAAKRVFFESAQQAGGGAAAAAAAEPMSPEQAATLRGVLAGAVEPDNALFALMFGRLAEVLLAYMRGEDAAATDLVGRYGFRPFEALLAAAGGGMRRVLDHSVAVHGPLYSRIVKEEATAAMQQALTAAAAAAAARGAAAAGGGADAGGASVSAGASAHARSP